MTADPPGLPHPLADEHTTDGPLSTWDALARAAIEICYDYLTYSNRVRIVWHCRQRMRIGVAEVQPKTVTFGWERESKRFRACRACGYIKDMY